MNLTDRERARAREILGPPAAGFDDHQLLSGVLAFGEKATEAIIEMSSAYTGDGSDSDGGHNRVIELSFAAVDSPRADTINFALDRPTREAIAKLLGMPAASDGKPIGDQRLLAGLFGYIADRSPPPDAVDVVLRPKSIRGALEKLGYRTGDGMLPDAATLLREAIDHAKKLKAGGASPIELSTTAGHAPASNNPLMGDLAKMFPKP
ncbi:MAG TPA: hypothetical protein VF624_03800 [Tepidisphaeraceae bacterium]|jgi:hypothetical protein